ncbi:MAG: hypothetical protein QOK21_499 [Solirubrobacteraceae bacterium]|jgi:signal transduction histidine kinase/uncharacterized protein YhfF|nr:hypothetical protein [Solirubrobacteraceae bacterium]
MTDVTASSRDDLLRSVVAGTAGVVGDAFLHRLVRAVGEALGAEACWVAALVEGRPVARVVACWPAGALPEGDERPLAKGLAGDHAVDCPGSDGRTVGFLAVTAPGPVEPSPGDLEALQIFAARAGAELERRDRESRLREREAEIVASRARVLAAADEERRRIGRNLHDGAQQRLVALSQFLGVASRKLQRGEPAEAERLIALAREQVEAAGTELRDLARGLHPVALERGLALALDTLAMQSSLPLEVAALPDRRLPDVLEATIYYVVAEALSNAAKHAQATRVRVAVVLESGRVGVTVDDDGVGGADPDRGSGLAGLAGRLEALGGTLDIASPSGGGTTLRLSIPVSAWRTPGEPFLEFGHGSDAGQGARRIAQVIDGSIRAGLSLAREWDLEGGLPRPGTLLPVRDHDGVRHATVRVTRVTVVAFSEVDEEMATAAMGEPTAVERWRADRRHFFASCRDEIAVLLGERDWRLTDDEPMACVWFTLADEPA